MTTEFIRILVPAAVTFFLGVAMTPLLTHYLYKYKAWKKKAGKRALDGTPALEFERLHRATEVRTPRMGGVVIWGSTALTILGAWILARVFPTEALTAFDFLSRNQTWIPFSTLLLGAGVGLVNDILDVVDETGERGIPLKVRLVFVSLLSLFVGYWFYEKLDVVSIGIPFAQDIYLGWLVIPFFILLSLFLYAGGVIDGIDGLSGGIFATVFASYAAVAFYQNQIDLAAFCAALSGGILAFLWFNVPPARFYMTETGTMGLTLTLAVVAFMTDALGEGHGIIALPIIAFPLVLTVASNVLQVASKKIRGKKLFLVAPLHHHFEALGWPGYKVTMRYWIISAMFAILGLIVALSG
jgi:phospho-N-acetylmuramoyl-pentapeptide-transferase